MDDTSRIEKAEASREARDAVAASPRSHNAEAVDSALRRYLRAEQYHELRDADHEPSASPPRQTA